MSGFAAAPPGGGAVSGEAVLALRGVSKSYPGVRALDDVDITFRTGTIHALLGENGAGKSTLLKIISGVEQPDTGRLVVDGEQRVLATPRAASDMGVSMVYQELSIVPQLSLAENVVLGRERHRCGVLSRRHARIEAARCMALLGWRGPLTRSAGSCSVATQQIAEIARALFRDQRVIILDEPTASLTQAEVVRLLALLRDLRDEGRTVVYVSHRLNEIIDLGADEVTVLRDGRRSGRFTLAGGYREADLVQAMVGRPVEVTPLTARPVGDAVLEVEEVQVRGSAGCSSFAVRAGEVVTIAGMVGSGRTELARALSGADPLAGGRIRVGGREITLRHPRHGIRIGIALLTEDRKGQGLSMNMSIAQNVTLVDPPARLGAISRRAQVTQAGEAGREVGLHRDPTVAVRTLSGGNQQKVVLARWIRSRSRIFIFDEPTRGVDIGAKEEIYHLIQRLAEDGAAILVISSELPEVLALGDRVLVMRGGAIVAEHPRATATEESIIRDATGSDHGNAG